MPTLVASSRGTESPRSVLIVDDSSESREVLRTVLERRGLEIFEARGALQGLEIARHHHPDVIVLDSEAESVDDEAVQLAFDEESRSHHGAVVMLGKTRRVSPSVPDDQVLAKPYHYGPLVHKIEQLIEQLARENDR